MPFRSPITVREAVEHIHERRYLLPSIQRELVWDTEQMERLFDSLMRDYPINSFLFWKVADTQKDEFQFYEFIRQYHEKTGAHNVKANVDGMAEVTAVLDGQQRLTALYLGLRGSYTYKLRWKRKDDPAAYPTRELYLNLLDKCGDEDRDMEYDFRFLTKSEAQGKDSGKFWYRVGDILDLDPNKPVEIYKLLSKYCLSQNEFAAQCLFKLAQVIHKEPAINYFEEQEPDLEKVLRIFVRINSAGEPLSHSDLLLSIATSQWKKRDAREEIYALVDELNSIRDGFAFSKDFVLKSCLVIGDFEIAFKVTNFNRRNMLAIEEQWEGVANSIRHAVSLVAGYGFNARTLTSNNAVIPIAYYLKKRGADDSFLTSSKYAEDRRTIRQWLTIALLKGAFGGQSDTTLRAIREVIDRNHDGFPVDDIRKSLARIQKSVSFTEEEVSGLLECTAGERDTFLVLSLLYPHLDFRNQFQQDHIHPRSFFTSPAKLSRLGVPKDQHNYYLENFNYLGNLQLLDGPLNQEKKDQDFAKWLRKSCQNADRRLDFLARNYIPDVDLSFGHFREFFKAREDLILRELQKTLLP